MGEEKLELKQLEFQEKEREREAQLKLKEIEYKEKELAAQLKLKELELKGTTAIDTRAMEKADRPLFDVSKHIRFVPTFSEIEVDKYFLHFEKVACSLKWPRDFCGHCVVKHTGRKGQRSLLSALLKRVASTK